MLVKTLIKKLQALDQERHIVLANDEEWKVISPTILIEENLDEMVYVLSGKDGNK